jgi:ABC-type ATPase involved in cell division
MQIEFKSVSFSYNKKVDTISDMTFLLNSGSRIFISGKAGSGKTTLINLITLQIKPYYGSILIDGKITSAFKKKDFKLLRNSTGLAAQSDKLISNLNCYENIILQSVISGINKTDANKRCLEILAGMKISYLRMKYPHELSSGEKKLVTMARSIVSKPQLVIIDEPLENLNIPDSEYAINFINEKIEKDTIFIIASQNEVINSFIPNLQIIDLNLSKLLSYKE